MLIFYDVMFQIYGFQLFHSHDIVGYDCIVGKKSAQYKQTNGGDKAAEEAAPRAKKAKLGVSVENYYPEHHVKGCYIPKLEIDLSKIPEFQEKNTDK